MSMRANCSLSRATGSVRAPMHARSALHSLPRPLCSRRAVIAQADKEDEPGDLESLFMQELKRRGLDSMDGGEPSSTGPATSTSTSKSPFQSATKTSQRTKQADAGVGDQRQRSIAMVNEGLEGLIPRASELLKLGGSIFLAFVPFIVAISLLFGGIYMVFGDHFVHGGDKTYGRPAYVDPQSLLSEPTVDPYVPYQ